MARRGDEPAAGAREWCGLAARPHGGMERALTAPISGSSGDADRDGSQWAERWLVRWRVTRGTPGPAPSGSDRERLKIAVRAGQPRRRPGAAAHETLGKRRLRAPIGVGSRAGGSLPLALSNGGAFDEACGPMLRGRVTAPRRCRLADEHVVYTAGGPRASERGGARRAWRFRSARTRAACTAPKATRPTRAGVRMGERRGPRDQGPAPAGATRTVRRSAEGGSQTLARTPSPSASWHLRDGSRAREERSAHVKSREERGGVERTLAGAQRGRVAPMRGTGRNALAGDR